MYRTWGAGSSATRRVPVSPRWFVYVNERGMGPVNGVLAGISVRSPGGSAEPAGSASVAAGQGSPRAVTSLGPTQDAGCG